MKCLCILLLLAFVGATLAVTRQQVHTSRLRRVLREAPPAKPASPPVVDNTSVTHFPGSKVASGNEAVASGGSNSSHDDPNYKFAAPVHVIGEAVPPSPRMSDEKLDEMVNKFKAELDAKKKAAGGAPAAASASNSAASASASVSASGAPASTASASGSASASASAASPSGSAAKTSASGAPAKKKSSCSSGSDVDNSDLDLLNESDEVLAEARKHINPAAVEKEARRRAMGKNK